ncbi:MAG: hypothetical protein KIT56_11020, partial [Gammaproteobacteria bacterium]|nr:hypothetical protein [Gammaproteobacteria bacterium]
MAKKEKDEKEKSRDTLQLDALQKIYKDLEINIDWSRLERTKVSKSVQDKMVKRINEIHVCYMKAKSDFDAKYNTYQDVVGKIQNPGEKRLLENKAEVIRDDFIKTINDEIKNHIEGISSGALSRNYDASMQSLSKCHTMAFIGYVECSDRVNKYIRLKNQNQTLQNEINQLNPSTNSSQNISASSTLEALSLEKIIEEATEEEIKQLEKEKGFLELKAVMSDETLKKILQEEERCHQEAFDKMKLGLKQCPRGRLNTLVEKQIKGLTDRKYLEESKEAEDKRKIWNQIRTTLIRCREGYPDNKEYLNSLFKGRARLIIQLESLKQDIYDMRKDLDKVQQSISSRSTINSGTGPTRQSYFDKLDENTESREKENLDKKKEECNKVLKSIEGLTKQVDQAYFTATGQSINTKINNVAAIKEKVDDYYKKGKAVLEGIKSEDKHRRVSQEEKIAEQNRIEVNIEDVVFNRVPLSDMPGYKLCFASADELESMKKLKVARTEILKTFNENHKKYLEVMKQYSVALNDLRGVNQEPIEQEPIKKIDGFSKDQHDDNSPFFDFDMECDEEKHLVKTVESDNQPQEEKTDLVRKFRNEANKFLTECKGCIQEEQRTRDAYRAIQIIIMEREEKRKTFIKNNRNKYEKLTQQKDELIEKIDALKLDENAIHRKDNTILVEAVRVAELANESKAQCIKNNLIIKNKFSLLEEEKYLSEKDMDKESTQLV